MRASVQLMLTRDCDNFQFDLGAVGGGLYSLSVHVLVFYFYSSLAFRSYAILLSFSLFTCIVKFTV